MSEKSDVERLAHPCVFINFAVRDLAAATAFYTALGWNEITASRTDYSASLRINGQVVVVLLSGERFAKFNDRDTADAYSPREVINCVQVGEKEDVDEMVMRVTTAGGRITRKAAEDGAVYSAAFDDVDGHGWELMWVNPSAIES